MVLDQHLARVVDDHRQRGDVGADPAHQDRRALVDEALGKRGRSEEHTSELQSLMRISYAVFCLKKQMRNSNAVFCLNKTTMKQRQKTTLHNVTRTLRLQTTNN